MSAPLKAGRHDHALRRRATRFGRQKGCRVDIPAEALVRAGFDPDGPLPWYRTFGVADGNRGQVIVRLYREP